MEPVRTEDCNLVYKGPRPDIGDLWVHRVTPGTIRATFEPSEEELEVLKAGGRIRLSIMREPIPPIMISVVTKENSEPVGPHGWKIDKEPGDSLEVGDEEESKSESTTQSTNGSTPHGQEAEAGAGGA